MNREKVISREYKIVLKAEYFSGTEAELLKKAKVFWKSFKDATKPAVKNFKEQPIKISEQRWIRFYDTQEKVLINHDYIFRERAEIRSGKKEVTLKFRHPDRYVSQDRYMLSKRTGKGEVKFEEDIKTPFIVLYSFSSTHVVKEDFVAKKFKQLRKLYLGLVSIFGNEIDEKEVFIVNGLHIHEKVVSLGEVVLSDEFPENAECALIVWYESKKGDANPGIVEFSFRYGSKKERYDCETAQRAYELFLLMQKEMQMWIDENNLTKTGFVYGRKGIRAGSE